MVIENETGEVVQLVPRTLQLACDVINRGDPGNVTIWGAAYQNGEETDSCEQEIHLSTNEVKKIFFYLEIRPEVQDYTYKFGARDEEPD